jgi:hypothetical protein
MPQNIPLPSPAAGRPELVVIAKSSAGLRASGAGIAADAGAAPQAAGLQARLAARGAVMRPLFGLSEDRLQAQRADVIEGRPNAETATADVPDLSVFYQVEAEGDLEALAEELRADPTIDAAYVKPAGEPPQGPGMALARGINDMQPAADDAPPATPNFFGRQGYLGAAPAGIDAQ